MKKKNTKAIYLYAIILIISIAALITTISIDYSKIKNVKYEEFLQMVEDQQVEKIKWTANSEFITFSGKDNIIYKTENPKSENFKEEMLMKGIDVKESSMLKKAFYLVINVFPLIIYIILFKFMISTMGIGRDSFKNKCQDAKSDIEFKDIAGLTEVKEDLISVVDFIKNPKKYKKAGAEVPKGVLLYGPPGTGKTMLAKAVAGEAHVAFRAVSGSDFEEKFVGVGANKIRRLFEDAKANAPCIIFIDEIDALGGKRTSGQTSWERMTLNALLSEMDGFDENSGIFIIGATNRIEDLDSALTRPGRFDNHFAVNLPETEKERRSVIDLYSKNKKFEADMDKEYLAKETIGNSPATIKTIINDAAIIAARDNNGIINRKIIDEAWTKQIMEGHLKKDGNKENIELIAWHEAGHALLGLLTKQEVTKVSIIPSTAGTGGATFITPKKINLYTKEELKNQIMMLYAGRNAELIYTKSEDSVTTGASNDIEKATELLRKMIVEYGMTNTFGLLNLNEEKSAQTKITNEMIRIAKELNESSYVILYEHFKQLKALADALIEKETLRENEIKKIIS